MDKESGHLAIRLGLYWTYTFPAGTYDNYSLADISGYDDSFDVILDRQAIQHNTIENIEKTINEVKRVLRKGGSFFSTMISEADYDIDTTYITEKAARKLLSDFKIISIDKHRSTYDNQKKKHSLLIIHVLKI